MLARQRTAEQIWNLASRLYYYWPSDLDDDPAKTPWWQAEVAFQCTEAQADAAFDRMVDAVCGEDHHHLAPCRFRIGSYRMLSEAEFNGEDE